MNGVKDNSLLVKDNTYEFSYGLINFHSNTDVLYDDIEDDEKK